MIFERAVRGGRGGFNCIPFPWMLNKHTFTFVHALLFFYDNQSYSNDINIIFVVINPQNPNLKYVLIWQFEFYVLAIWVTIKIRSLVQIAFAR